MCVCCTMHVCLCGMCEVCDVWRVCHVACVWRVACVRAAWHGRGQGFLPAGPADCPLCEAGHREAPVEDAEGTWLAARDHCAGHCRSSGPAQPVSCQPDRPAPQGELGPRGWPHGSPGRPSGLGPGSTRQGGDPAEGPAVPRPAAVRGPLISPLHGPGGRSRVLFPRTGSRVGGPCR